MAALTCTCPGIAGTVAPHSGVLRKDMMKHHRRPDGLRGRCKRCQRFYDKYLTSTAYLSPKHTPMVLWDMQVNQSYRNQYGESPLPLPLPPPPPSSTFWCSGAKGQTERHDGVRFEDMVKDSSAANGVSSMCKPCKRLYARNRLSDPVKRQETRDYLKAYRAQEKPLLPCDRCRYQTSNKWNLRRHQAAMH